MSASEPSQEGLVRLAVKLLRTESGPDKAQFILNPMEYKFNRAVGGYTDERAFAKFAPWLNICIQRVASMRRVTSDDRRALQAYLKVLNRLRVARNKIRHLDGLLLDERYLTSDFELSERTSFQLTDERYLAGDFELLERTPYQSLFPIEDEIAIVKVMLAQSGGGSNNQARFAASLARHLLQRFKIPAVASRGSTWCRLSAILYGEPSKDFYQFVCEIRKRAKSKSVAK